MHKCEKAPVKLMKATEGTEKMRRYLHSISLAMAISVLGSQPVLAELEEKRLSVVGTWSNLSQWRQFESKFWGEDLPSASGGKLTANARPLDEMGMSGPELMRQLKLGVFDIVHTLVATSASDVPMAGGIDLAGLVRDRDGYNKLISAYQPALAAEFERIYDAKLLALYSFSSYSMFCNLPAGARAGGIDSLRGLKIRSHSISMSDFIEGLGGIPVTIPFAEVVPALQQGVVDCGVTGVLSAYESKWWQVTNTYFQFPLGFGTVAIAANMDFWNSLAPETRAFLEGEVAKLAEEISTSSVEEDDIGDRCYASGPCDMGEPGRNETVQLNDADVSKVNDVVSENVLKRFAQRCGADCARIWNDSVGAVLGVSAAQ